MGLSHQVQLLFQYHQLVGYTWTRGLEGTARLASSDHTFLLTRGFGLKLDFLTEDMI